MFHLKTRLFALVLIVVSVGLVYYNWRQLLEQREYLTKLAAFAPLVGVGGLFLLIFPEMSGKPETIKEKVTIFIVVFSRLGIRFIQLVFNGSGLFPNIRRLFFYELSKWTELFLNRSAGILPAPLKQSKNGQPAPLFKFRETETFRACSRSGFDKFILSNYLSQISFGETKSQRRSNRPDQAVL